MPSVQRDLPQEDDRETYQVQPKAPCSVTLLIIGVLIFTSTSLIRGVQALLQWEFLQELLPISPLYLALSGFLWGAAGLPLIVGLVKGRRWALRFTLAAVLAYSIYYWLDRLLLTSDRGESNWLFAIVLNLLLLLLVSWIQSRPRVKAFFGVSHDRQPKNQSIK